MLRFFQKLEYILPNIGDVKLCFFLEKEINGKNCDITVDKNDVMWNKKKYSIDENIIISNFINSERFDNLILDYINDSKSNL